MSLKIFIDYKTTDSGGWRTIELTPEEYFDLSLLDSGEKIEWNSVPEFNYAIEYLDIDPKLIANTRIRINDGSLGIMRTIATTFWNKGFNFIIERIDSSVTSSSCRRLLITNTILEENPLIREIMRVKEIEGMLEVEFHSFIKDNEDGSQSERIVFPIDCS